MTRCTFCLAQLLLGVCLLANAEPATRPAAVIPKDETPLQALHRMFKVFDTLDKLEACVALNQINDEAQRQYAVESCRYALALVRVEQATEARFGSKAAADVAHAAFDLTDADIDRGKVTLNGDKATVKFDGSENVIWLIRVGGVWKYNTAESVSPQPAERAADLARFKRQETLLTQLAADVQAARFPTADAVLKEIRKVTDVPDVK